MGVVEGEVVDGDDAGDDDEVGEHPQLDHCRL